MGDKQEGRSRRLPAHMEGSLLMLDGNIYISQTAMTFFDS